MSLCIPLYAPLPCCCCSSMSSLHTCIHVHFASTCRHTSGGSPEHISLAIVLLVTHCACCSPVKCLRWGSIAGAASVTPVCTAMALP